MPSDAPPSTLLSAIARLLDAGCHGWRGHTVILLSHVPDDPTTVELALADVDPDEHPCRSLRGLVVPARCWGLGLVVHGRAHLLDAVDEAAQPVVSTYVRHRDGRQVSLLRRGDRVTEQRGLVAGRLPELCRRILETSRSGTADEP
jgi:hypothetical protein